MNYNSRLVRSKDNCERTPLHLACLHGRTKIAQIHSDHSHLKSISEWRDAEGNTALHLACSGGSAGIVKLLINSKAKAKATNKLNEMPLHIAVRCGHVPIAQLLLENRVPIECKTVEGHTPLHCAAKENNTEMIALLVGRYVLRFKMQVVTTAQANNLCSNFSMWTLTHRDADLKSKDNNYCTPTHIAAMHQYTEAYQYTKFGSAQLKNAAPLSSLTNP